jgi:hypothetical protein
MYSPINADYEIYIWNIIIIIIWPWRVHATVVVGKDSMGGLEKSHTDIFKSSPSNNNFKSVCYLHFLFIFYLFFFFYVPHIDCWYCSQKRTHMHSIVLLLCPKFYFLISILFAVIYPFGYTRLTAFWLENQQP